MTTPEATAAEHAAFVLRLLKLTGTPARDRAVREVTTHGKDTGEPTIGRLALVGSSTKPRVGVITAVTPTKVTVSHFTDNAVKEAKRAFGRKSHPIHLDGWPGEYRDYWHRMYEQGYVSYEQHPTVESFDAFNYQWALNTQAVFRTVIHFPFIAYAPIRNTGVPRDALVMIPENGENQ